MPINPIRLPSPYPEVDSGQWNSYQILENFQFLAAQITAIRRSYLVPQGALILMRSGSTCPTGYTKVTDATLADRYLRINLSAGGATGGSSAVTITDPGHGHSLAAQGNHTHPVSIPTSTRLVTSAASGTTVAVASGTHTHTLTVAGTHTHALGSAVTGISAVATPKYLDVILCQKT